MATFQAIFAFIVRSLGRILNTAFGWATVLLFGKVPAARQTLLSIVTLTSVIWLATTAGIAFPSFGTFMLAFVTLPDWVDDRWIRLFMLGASATLPLVVGALSYFMLAPEDRPGTVGGIARAVLRGYPYTLGLGLTLLMMIAFAPIMKTRQIVRRWSNEHVPVVIEARDYPAVVDDIREALARGGLPTERTLATWMLRVPTKVLAFFASENVQRLIAEELAVLRSVDEQPHDERARRRIPTFEILLHPSDIVISGRALDTARAHAILNEHLPFTRAYMTTTKEAHEIEDALHSIWRKVKASSRAGFVAEDAIASLRSVDARMKAVEVSYDEWDVLFRQRLLVERTVLRVATGIEGGMPIDRNALQSLKRQADAA